jgi:hypothetical protein
MKTRVALLACLITLSLVAGASAQVSTVEGTVVSNSGGSLVVDTASGQRTFMVDAQSSLPADLAVGTRVKVEYHTLANDKFHAFKVSAMDAAPTTATAPSMAGTTTTPAPVEPAPAAVAPAPPMQERPTTTTTTTTTDTTTGTMNTTTTADTGSRLPATASPLPLLALAGGLAMAGGALVRRLRS